MTPCFIRIYLYMSKEFFKNIEDVDLESIIKQISFICDNDSGEYVINGNPALRKTKKMIQEKALAFCDRLDEELSDETLGSFISIRQINSLIRALNERKGKISGYAFIILHTMYCCIASQEANCEHLYFELLKCVNSINMAVEAYYAEYFDDTVAHFLIESYDVVKREIESQGAYIAHISDFPPIPKRNIDDVEE